MTQKRLPPDDPRELLNRVRSNLACALAYVLDAYVEDLCFNAQQAAEKSIKAVFIHRSLRFPFVHNLGELLNLLEQSGHKVPKCVWEADELSVRRHNTLSRSGCPRHEKNFSPRRPHRGRRAALGRATD